MTAPTSGRPIGELDTLLLRLCHRFGWIVVEVPVRWAHVAGSLLGADHTGSLAGDEYVRSEDQLRPLAGEERVA